MKQTWVLRNRPRPKKKVNWFLKTTLLKYNLHDKIYLIKVYSAFFWKLELHNYQSPQSTFIAFPAFQEDALCPCAVSPHFPHRQLLVYFCLYRCINWFFCFNIYLAVLSLSCGVQDLIPWWGIEPRASALGAWSLSHWTTWGVPINWLLTKV